MNIRPLLLTIARKLLLMALDQGLRRALPVIYKRLDAELPYWLRQTVSPNNVEGLIAQAASDALGRSPEPYELSLVRLLYDPVAAVANATFKPWERKQ